MHKYISHITFGVCVGRAAGSGGVEHEKRLTVVDGDANRISDPNLLLVHKIAAQGDKEEKRGMITPFAEAVFQARGDSYGGFEETHMGPCASSSGL